MSRLLHLFKDALFYSACIGLIGAGLDKSVVTLILGFVFVWFTCLKPYIESSDNDQNKQT